MPPLATTGRSLLAWPSHSRPFQEIFNLSPRHRRPRHGRGPDAGRRRARPRPPRGRSRRRAERERLRPPEPDHGAARGRGLPGRLRPGRRIDEARRRIHGRRARPAEDPAGRGDTGGSSQKDDSPAFGWPLRADDLAASVAHGLRPGKGSAIVSSKVEAAACESRHEVQALRAVASPDSLSEKIFSARLFRESHPSALVLCPTPLAPLFPKQRTLSLGSSPEEIARGLFAALRTRRRGSELLVLAVPRRGLGRTIMDRLERAATRIV